jgi:hypothetical protein
MTQVKRFPWKEPHKQRSGFGRRGEGCLCSKDGKAELYMTVSTGPIMPAHVDPSSTVVSVQNPLPETTPLSKALCGQAPMAHACKPSYSGTREQKDQGSNARQIVCKTLSQKIPITKRAGRVAQGEGPEFKPQCRKKKKSLSDASALKIDRLGDIFSLCSGHIIPAHQLSL